MARREFFPASSFKEISPSPLNASLKEFLSPSLLLSILEFSSSPFLAYLKDIFSSGKSSKLVASFSTGLSINESTYATRSRLVLRAKTLRLRTVVLGMFGLVIALVVSLFPRVLLAILVILVALGGWLSVGSCSSSVSRGPIFCFSYLFKMSSSSDSSKMLPTLLETLSSVSTS